MGHVQFDDELLQRIQSVVEPGDELLTPSCQSVAGLALVLRKAALAASREQEPFVPVRGVHAYGLTGKMG